MTPLENLPSDNLYKFIFFVGVTLIFGGIILIVTQYDKIINKVDNFNEKKIYLKNDVILFNVKIDRLNSAVSRVEDNLKLNKDSSQIISAVELNRSNLDELSDFKNKIKINIDLLELIANQVKREIYRLFIYMGLSLLMLISGLLLSYSGFNSWYSKVQKPLDDKLKLEILNMSNQKN